MGEACRDVVILGGGPAGTGTALALRRHAPELSVLVLESTGYGALRVGETLPPPTRRLLEHLGVWRAFLGEGHAPSPGTAAAWGDDEPYENEYLYWTEGEGWHLDRARFDAFLARQSGEEGAEVRTGHTFVGAERRSGCWRLTVRGSGKEEGGKQELDARFVVDATGRRAAFARRLGMERLVCDDLLGLYVYFRTAEPVAAARRTLVEAWEEGWWYSAALPSPDRSGDGGGLAIACMSDADRIGELGLRRRQTWWQALEASHLTRRLLDGADLGESRLEEDPICVPAQSQLLERAAGEDWLAVGDAASTFDPLSSQGIFSALRFAIWASYAIADHLGGDADALHKYAGLVARSFDGYLDSRAAYYRQERRWSAAPFWHRRADHLTLAPRTRLRTVADAPARTRLPRREVARLRELCRRPRAAHEVVTAYRREACGPAAVASDHRIILALQDLVEQGVLAPVRAGRGISRAGIRAQARSKSSEPSRKSISD
ncbi:MAG: tryptophan 7-halogenase [Holophagales bacterium]|nr:tryptophan 7-halogenase [Holophagales bacterium]